MRRPETMQSITTGAVKIGVWGVVITLMLPAVARCVENRVDLFKRDGVQEWRVYVEEMPLKDLYRKLEKVSGTRFHYNGDVNVRVSAFCRGNHLETILKCLMGEEISLIFRFSVAHMSTMPSEVWILGGSQVMQLASAEHDERQYPSGKFKEANTRYTADISERINQFLEQADSVTPSEKALQLSTLIADKSIGNDVLEPVLYMALQDDEVQVRLQALHGLEQRLGSNAITLELQQALKDGDMNMRLKAVEISSDPRLLEQALADNSQIVQRLAEQKLVAMRKKMMH